MSGRYKILEELGAGGAGSVCKAYDTQLDRYVALKRLLTKEEEQQQDAQSSVLRKEAASLATLQHPNIVTIYDLGSDEKGMFIVMELLEGDTLADWLKGGTMNAADFYELATQTLEGALSAHDQSILHRDLKPENMKVKRLPGGRLQVKIVDFGLARLSYGARKQTEDHRGHILGSIFYMAPEQFRRLPLDGRTDLYSLGCVYYQALAGRRPFQAQSVAEVMDLHLKHQVTLLHELRPDLHPQVCDWVMWLMAREPGDRPANAHEALDSLRALAAEGLLAETAAPPAVARTASSGVAGHSAGGGPARTTSSQQPARRSTSSTGAAPAASTIIPQLPTVTSYSQPPAEAFAQPDEEVPAVAPRRERPAPAPAPAPAPRSSWYLWGGIAAAGLVVAGGVFLWIGRNASKKGTAASTGLAADAFHPPKQPADLLATDHILHYRAGSRCVAWHELTQPARDPVPGDPVVEWRDLSDRAGTGLLTAPDRRRETCPKFIFEQPAGFKDSVGFLRFEPRNCMIHAMSGSQNESAEYPFGESVKKSGLTIFLMVQPALKGKEVRCLQLRNQNGGGWLELLAFPNNEFRARAGVRQPDGTEMIRECKAGGRGMKQFSLVSLRWDAAANKITLMARSSSDGGKSRGETAAPPGCPVLNEVRFSEAGSDAGVFTGDVLELIVWPRLMTQDQHAEQAHKLASFYFNKPGDKW